MGCDQIGRLIGLWATFRSLWQQLGNFCKGVKIFIFSSEIRFGATFIDIWRLFTRHTEEGWHGLRFGNQFRRWIRLSVTQNPV